MIRKIDFWLQVAILFAFVAFVIYTAIFTSYDLIFAGLFLLLVNIFQIISAFCLTFFTSVPNAKKILSLYWKIQAVAVVLYAIALFVDSKILPDSLIVNILIWASMIGFLVLPFYYLYLHKKYFFKQ